MLYGLYLSTAGAKAQSYRQDILANNIANVGTAGFRQQFAVIRQRLSHVEEFGGPPPAQIDDPRRMGGGPAVFEAPDDLATQGTIKVTGRRLDVAINGEGFFRVRNDEGTFLTRHGGLALDSGGTLLAHDGKSEVLSTDDEPIRVDANRPFEIWRDGQVYQYGTRVGTIDLSLPLEPRNMRRSGESLFAYDGPLEPAEGTVEQNMLEGSNVEPIRQMTELIETGRAFELNANMIQMQADSLRTLLDRVPRLA